MKQITLLFALFLALNLQASVMDSIPPCIEWNGDLHAFDSLRNTLSIPDNRLQYDTLVFELYRDSLGAVIDTVTVYQVNILNSTGPELVNLGECVVRGEGQLYAAPIRFYEEIKRIYLLSLE